MLFNCSSFSAVVRGVLPVAARGFVAIALLCGALATPAAPAHSANVFEGLQPIRPSAPNGDCNQIPFNEKRKFDGCGLQVEFQYAEEAKKERRKARDLAEEETRLTWDWLGARPQADCRSLPETELKKFFCRNPKQEANQALEAVIEDLWRSRTALAAQIRNLEDRKARLANRAANLASRDAKDQLAALLQLERAVKLKAAERTLLSRLGRDPHFLDSPSTAASNGTTSRPQSSNNASGTLDSNVAVSRPKAVAHAAVSMRFAVAKKDAPYYLQPRLNARPLGALRKGELIMVLEEAGPSAFIALLRAEGGIVYARSGVLE